MQCTCNSNSLRQHPSLINKPGGRWGPTVNYSWPVHNEPEAEQQCLLSSSSSQRGPDATCQLACPDGQITRRSVSIPCGRGGGAKLRCRLRRNIDILNWRKMCCKGIVLLLCKVCGNADGCICLLSFRPSHNICRMNEQ